MVYLNPPAGGGASLPTFTEGSIIFADALGALAEDNSNLFWDDTNNFLGVGVNSALNGRLHVEGASDSVGNSFYSSNLSNTSYFRVRNLSDSTQDAFLTGFLTTNITDAIILNLGTNQPGNPKFNFFSNGVLEFSSAGKIGIIAPTFNNTFFLTNGLSSGGIALGYESDGVFGADPISQLVSVGFNSTFTGTGVVGIAQVNLVSIFNQGSGAGVGYGILDSTTLTSITGSYTGYDFNPTVTSVAALYGIRIRSTVAASSFGHAATPDAFVHVGAATAAGVPQIKFTLGGTILTTPENGTLEANNTHIYWTDSTGTRFQLDQQSGVGGATQQLDNLSAVAINTTLVSDTHNTDALGTAAIGWSDLFLGTGALINFENGDAVITHSAGILTVSTGDFRVTTAGTNAASVVTVGGTQTLTAKTINGGTLTGVIDGGGATSFELPNSAAPTVDADGEIAVDTTVTDFSHGLIRYFAGEELMIVAMPVAQFTSPTGNYVVSYDATADEFQLKAAGGAGITWTEVTGTSQSAAVNNGYITNNVGLVTVTLPGTFAIGDIVRVKGVGAGGWRIAVASGDQVIWDEGGVDGTNETTITTGTLDSTDDNDAIELIGVTANALWSVLSVKGNISLS